MMRARLLPLSFLAFSAYSCGASDDDPGLAAPVANAGSASGGAPTTPLGNAAGGNAAGSSGSSADQAGSSAGGSGGTQNNPPTQGGGGSMSAAGSGGAPVMRPEPTCTDQELRTAPPAGKESFKVDPIDETFPFSSHWVGRFNDEPAAVGITGMADFDDDGDLDFASGQRGGNMQWWEYCSPDHWVQHVVGEGHDSPGGGNAVDVDGDGWVDLIAGDSWYKNPQNPRESEWERYGIGIAAGEDIAVGDLSGDGKPDVLWVWDSIQPQWRAPAADPTQPWPVGAEFENRQTQGGFIGDIDGDGDNDAIVGNAYWYRNLDGLGTDWESVAIGVDFDDSPLTSIGDLDGDGDMDFAMCTHFGSNAAWVENLDGDGTQFELHLLADDKDRLHAIFALDFDNDGDLDIYSGESTGEAWIWENTGNATFVEHTAVANARGHDARVGDVDCDGDLDIVGKPWGEGAGETEPRDHIYLQNMTVERGGPAVFVRPAGEVWHKTQERKYCP